ncbi:Uncharacterised protein (plasmid) [Tsukamurella tyrosinosolvens]|uniref:Uncharacterized protein n=1 Tax=Tsukamurella tyrosinosolvens TaxID=57704 RepID=A0A1H4I6Q1_TSUTY|nr:hypothetical protein [Tsukamurella tyrosinosolvens]KXO92770.1 hypothetical protein AXK58_19430 [Tsukamurella tyrosinosolvens]SEB29643.1 hypothetical protein SAMN04489793_0039 [Tsukamurella tyrosinosolvens]VEH95851.1 Uncharacterised protein [Tsukamurella tyrosinosolvens]
MPGDLTDELQAAAERMGLPPLKFHTPLAQRIQRGDVEEVISGYMAVFTDYQSGDRRCTVGRLLQLSYLSSPFAWTCEQEFGPQVGSTFANNEDAFLGLRVAGEVLLPQEIVDVICEFLACSVYVADLASQPSADEPDPWEWAWSGWPPIHSLRLETMRAIGVSGAPATRIWFLDMLDEAFAAGWTIRRRGGLLFDPPEGTDSPWIKLAAIDPGNLASVKRFASKLRRAGVTVPERPTVRGAA